MEGCKLITFQVGGKYSLVHSVDKTFGHYCMLEVSQLVGLSVARHIITNSVETRTNTK